MNTGARSRERLALGHRLDRAAQIVTRARCFYDIWRYLRDARAHPETLEAMQDYSEFFRFDEEANFSAFIVHIAGLFETTRSDTINFKQLIEEYGYTEDNRLNELSVEAVPIVAKARILRHKLFAHRDDTETYADVFRRAAVSADELRQLTDIALKIANRLLLLSGQGSHFFNEFTTNHLDRMFERLGIPLSPKKHSLTEIK